MWFSIIQNKKQHSLRSEARFHPQEHWAELVCLTARSWCLGVAPVLKGSVCSAVFKSHSHFMDLTSLAHNNVGTLQYSSNTQKEQKDKSLCFPSSPFMGWTCTCHEASDELTPNRSPTCTNTRDCSSTGRGTTGLGLCSEAGESLITISWTATSRWPKVCYTLLPASDGGRQQMVQEI